MTTDIEVGKLYEEQQERELIKKFLDLVWQGDPNHEEKVKESIAKRMIFLWSLQKQFEEGKHGIND